MKDREIRGDTRTVAIFGWPLQYTLSPVFQNAALRGLKRNAVYVPMAVESGSDFRRLLRACMASPSFVGANVTNPHKVAALTSADKASPTAKAIGAANTLVREKGKWVAHNTDAPGFLAAAKSAGARAKGARVLILGNGGVARSVVWAVAQAGASEIAVLGRKKTKADACAKIIKTKSFGYLLTRNHLFRASQAADWIVNTIPGAELGRSWAEALASAKSGAWAMDLSYLPRPQTPFLKRAGRLGYKTLDGLPMLLEQGRLSFKLWFGSEPKLEVLQRSVRNSMR